MISFESRDAFEGAFLSARAMAARPRPYLDGLNLTQRETVEKHRSDHELGKLSNQRRVSHPFTA